MFERVGFIGLGSIGELMARNLCGTFETVVYDLDPNAIQKLVDAGAKAASSSSDVGARCEVIGVCVVDDEGTKAVVAGEDGILAGASPGTIIAIHSTIHPDTARGLADIAKDKGVHVVDAQMTGGPGGAEARQLRYMVGGDEEVLDRCRPVFSTSAAQITHCGGVGTGAIAKLCNNLVQYSAWMAMEEGFRLAKHAGVDEAVLTDVLRWIMNDNARVFMSARSVREGNPDIPMLNERFDAAMLLAEKDLSIALELARSTGVSMPTTGLCRQQVGRLFASPDLKRR